MNLADLYGLLAILFVAASGIAALFPKKRLILCPVLVAVMLLPFGNFGSLAEYLFAFTDTVSIPLLAGSVYLLRGKPSPYRNRELFGILILGLALYITEEGLLPYDLYGWGYRFDFAAAVICLGIWFLPPLGGGLLFAGYLFFRFGIYQNFFDAVLDPILFLTALLELARRYFSAKKAKKGENTFPTGKF